MEKGINHPGSQLLCKEIVFLSSDKEHLKNFPVGFYGRIYVSDIYFRFIEIELLEQCCR